MMRTRRIGWIFGLLALFLTMAVSGSPSAANADSSFRSDAGLCSAAPHGYDLTFTSMTSPANVTSATADGNPTPLGSSGAVAVVFRSLVAAEGAARFVAGSDGIIDTEAPALQQQISDVVGSIRETGEPPEGVRQGGYQGQKGVYANNSGALPEQPLGYYTESDVWPGPGPRGTERVVVGDGGEAWYSPDHYGTFRSVP